MRDGFNAASAGGTVRLRDDGTPVLDYPLTPYVWDGVRRAFRAMAEIQFAAGARQVSPAHGYGAPFTSFATARAAIDAFDLRPLYTRVVSAHVMGGAPLRRRSSRSVVGIDGRHHHVAQPVRVRRLAVPDVDRRQSAAVDLRVRGAHRHGPRRIISVIALDNDA